MGTKIISNKNVALFGGLSGVFPADWTKPTLAELGALSPVSEAVRWNSFGVNVQASNQIDSRVLSDGAGAQERGYAQFGGDMQVRQPVAGDTTSSYAVAKGIFGAPNVQTIAALRSVTEVSQNIAGGQEFAYIMHTLTDAQSFGRDDEAAIYYGVTLLPQSDLLVNYVVPDGATKVALTASAATVTTTSLIFVKALYFGIDVTKQVVWTISDATKLEMLHPGIFRGVAAGSATISATFAGDSATAPAAPVSITVS